LRAPLFSSNLPIPAFNSIASNLDYILEYRIISVLPALSKQERAKTDDAITGPGRMDTQGTTRMQ